MESVRKGLRAGDITKDTYDRLQCARCEAHLSTQDDPDEVGSLRICPDCGREWRQVD
ncbi:MAG: HVO_0758 family zinc finger protein [Halobacteriaceae archaeon]